ncbi:hypothetical protein EPA93_46725 [Ktedonosporobacter rubrisoli]|uniref:Uncharacterized protein n=1 Tax=Ktedonosporobacter rubrisoli TaxID=2509675 RepID=A0A4P6K4F0_KTERU|nr:hypothetical protein [Ktedonosporobacter rubrisoli]QBD83064.1 hypothetical protein EPA93_46725 [Ktedonosporobacter rubrisoli]
MKKCVTSQGAAQDKQLQDVTPASHDNGSQASSEVSIDSDFLSETSPVIWTPRFIAIFTLILVVGLSATSLLTQGWLNHYYEAELVLLNFAVLLFLGWIALIICARSLWARIAGVFGCIWAIFTGVNFAITLLAADAHAVIDAHLNAATNSAMLGCYICLSINRTAIYRWDGWFFRFAPIIGACVIVVAFLFAPADAREPAHVESIVAGVTLYLSLLVWWLRPSCWRAQPGPTFLFGFVPIILLILSLVSAVRPETNFFFLQIMLLCTFLGIIRTLQGEIRYSAATPINDAETTTQHKPTV